MEPIAIGSLIAALSVLLGIWVAVGKIKKGFKEEIMSDAELAIQKAHTMAKGDLEKFQGQINLLTERLSNMDEKFQKDVAHIRETYNNEIKNLGTKIEDLREEMRHQHTQLIDLLTQMVKEK